MGGNVYLGKTVPDTGKPGLDNLNEVRGICDAILEDYRRGRISYHTAMSRLNLLSLIVTKDYDFKENPRKFAAAKAYIARARLELKRMRAR